MFGFGVIFDNWAGDDVGLYTFAWFLVNISAFYSIYEVFFSIVGVYWFLEGKLGLYARINEVFLSFESLGRLLTFYTITDSSGFLTDNIYLSDTWPYFC